MPPGSSQGSVASAGKWFGECAERHRAAPGQQHPAPAQRDGAGSQRALTPRLWGFVRSGSPGSAEAAAPRSARPAPVRARARCQESRATGQPPPGAKVPWFYRAAAREALQCHAGPWCGQGGRQGCSPTDVAACHRLRPGFAKAVGPRGGPMALSGVCGEKPSRAATSQRHQQLCLGCKPGASWRPLQRELVMLLKGNWIWSKKFPVSAGTHRSGAGQCPGCCRWGDGCAALVLRGTGGLPAVTRSPARPEGGRVGDVPRAAGGHHRKSCLRACAVTRRGGQHIAPARTVTKPRGRAGGGCWWRSLQPAAVLQPAAGHLLTGFL